MSARPQINCLRYLLSCTTFLQLLGCRILWLSLRYISSELRYYAKYLYINIICVHVLYLGSDFRRWGCFLRFSLTKWIISETFSEVGFLFSFYFSFFVKAKLKDINSESITPISLNSSFCKNVGKKQANYKQVKLAGSVL